MIAYARFDQPGWGGVYMISPDSGSPPIPLELDRPVTWLDWSPDGRFIAYTMEGKAIRVIDVQERSRSYAIIPPDDGVSEVPMWSPDGTKIAFGFRNDIWLVGVSGGEPVNISRNPTSYASFPDWSPSGIRVVYTEGGKLWVAAADGSSRSKIPLSGGAHFPRWSPGGDRIAFDYHGVFSVAPDGSDRRALTPNCDSSGVCEGGSEYQYAQWSPDGTRLVFMGRPDMNRPEIQLFVVNADGTGLRQLTDREDNQDPQWAPDGKSIVFWRSDGTDGNRLFTLALDGGAARQVTSAWGWYAFPRWRPDARAR